MPYIAQVAVGRRENLRCSAATSRHPGRHRRCATTSTSWTSPRGTSPRSTKLGTHRGAWRWNLGTGHGTSVLEMVHAFERAVGRELPYQVVGRRAGDVAVSFADPSRADARAGLAADPHDRRHVRRQVALAAREPHGYPDA